MASGGRTGERGRPPASGSGKAGARGARRAAAGTAGRAKKTGASGGLKKRAAAGTSKAASAKVSGTSTGKTAGKAPGKTAGTARGRPAWAVSGNTGVRRAHGGSRGSDGAPLISRRAILGGTALFVIGAAVGLHARRLEKQAITRDAAGSARSMGNATASAPPPGTVTMADMPDPASVTVDLPMAEGAAPEVLAAPLRPARVMLPDRAVLAGRPAVDSTTVLPRVPSWLSSLGPAPPTPAPAGAPPLPGHKPAEGHMTRAPASVTVASAAARPAPAPARSRAVPATPRAPLWLVNAVGVPDPGRRPMVSVVIDDLGLDRRRTAQVVALPGPLTLSFMSYARDLPAQTAAGHRAGHELMLHMPMQPSNARINPGPGALMVGQPADEIRRRLERALGGFAGYVGLNNHMGSRFTANRAGMGVVMAGARRHELLFLDSRTTGGSVAPGLAAREGVPFIERSIFLDHDPGRATVDRQLTQLERVAQRHGHAIAIGHPRDATIAGLTDWLRAAQARGLALVPASAVPRFARLA